MPGTDPIPRQETLENPEQDFNALNEASRTIDEILANDPEGERSSAKRSPYPSPGEVLPTRQVGDRYGEKVTRTNYPDTTVYSAEYSVKIEPPQPDSTKPGYSPYDYAHTSYTWNVDSKGTVTGIEKNEMGSKTSLAPEQVEDAMADINKLITDGLQSDKLMADNRSESANPSAPAEYTPPAKRRTALGRIASSLFGKK